MSADREWILGVSALNQYVSQSLLADPVLRSVRLRGEVSNFKAYPSGHWYFSLKDDRCKISCVMFRSSAMRMSFRPREGDQVILHGAVRLYEEGGQYQFVADSMRPEGVGSLYQRFEQLKEKLRAEGLFDQDRKRPLPLRPRRIAIVTSEAGAVLHDIRRVSARRDPSIPLVLLPVAVQGDGAAAQIAQAIRRAGTLDAVDVIITGRGGGSMEDLWAFNEEIVARAIADSPVPVISAVGHETDFTIADFVADVRASTPSNAAEMAVPDREEVRAAFRAMRKRLDAAMQGNLDRASLRLGEAQRRLLMVSPERRLQDVSQQVALLRTRLNQLAEGHLQAMEHRLPMAQLRLDAAIDQVLTRTGEQLRRNRMRLEAINPRRVLDRGYALVTDGSKVITSSHQATGSMTLQFHDGSVRVHREEEEADHGNKEKADL